MSDLAQPNSNPLKNLKIGFPFNTCLQLFLFIKLGPEHVEYIFLCVECKEILRNAFLISGIVLILGQTNA